MKKKIGLHWFRKDLRLQDNPSLAALASNVDELVCMYMLNDISALDNIESQSNTELLGEHRANFINQSLIDLDLSLKNFDQKLIVVVNEGLASLLDLIDSLGITSVSAEWHCGVNERNQWNDLISLRPELDYIQENGTTLYQESQFPFSIKNMPSTFSPFRKKVEKYCHVEALDAPLYTMPSSPLNAMPQNAMPKSAMPKSAMPQSAMPKSAMPKSAMPQSAMPLNALVTECLLTHNNHYPELFGGETRALAQLKYYLWETDLISTYKETRNGLDGWEFSSKLSAWLAQGCISPKRIYYELSQYESQRTKNNSTYWLFFELLWREFFHWHHLINGSKLFSLGGVQELTKPSAINPEIIKSWQQGRTGYPIVDACMRQLLATGFMSNRGRQLVASCFVHELAQDWRYGARYFEYQLVDFDVASNWGNWQYLAGVGADPRGHRQFNLRKQTETYDPQQHFIADWLT
jgi:deoxyribodipyrimidine photo-lyase